LTPEEKLAIVKTIGEIVAYEKTGNADDDLDLQKSALKDANAYRKEIRRKMKTL
jgi:hypothetical protein